MRISPELIQEMLSRFISVVCPVRFMVTMTSFRPPTTYTDMLRLRPGVYGYLRFSTVTAVDYGRNEIFDYVENYVTEKPRRRKRDGSSRNITVKSTDPRRISHGSSG